MGKSHTVLLRFVYFNECTECFVFKFILRYDNTVIFVYRMYECIDRNGIRDFTYLILTLTLHQLIS